MSAWHCFSGGSFPRFEFSSLICPDEHLAKYSEGPYANSQGTVSMQFCSLGCLVLQNNAR